MDNEPTKVFRKRCNESIYKYIIYMPGESSWWSSGAGYCEAVSILGFRSLWRVLRACPWKVPWLYIFVCMDVCMNIWMYVCIQVCLYFSFFKHTASFFSLQIYKSNLLMLLSSLASNQNKKTNCLVALHAIDEDHWTLHPFCFCTN